MKKNLRVPVAMAYRLFYPELAERGWCAERIAGDPGEVRLRLAPGTSGEPRPPATGGGVCPRVG